MRHAEQASVGKLVLSAANRVLREVLIDRRQLTIGRKSHNDLLLDDLTVSGKHAMVYTVAGESVIHDLKSRNGTLINGASVMQQQLFHGDCIDIGIYRLVYKVEFVEAGAGPRLAGLEDFASTRRHGMSADPGTPIDPPVAPEGGGEDRGPPCPRPSLKPSPATHTGSPLIPRIPLDPLSRLNPVNSLNPLDPSTPAALSPSEVVRPASLLVLAGHESGRVITLERPIVSIRNGSGQVAVVARRQDGYFLTHVEGLAYPLVNGGSIGLGAYVLCDNDLIDLAGTLIEFRRQG